MHVNDLVDLGAYLLLVGATIVNGLQFLDMSNPIFQLLFRRFGLWLFERLECSRPNLSPLLIRWETYILLFGDRVF